MSPYRAWFRVATDVLDQPDLVSARSRLAAGLLATFDASLGARFVVDHASGHLAMRLFPHDGGLDTERWPFGVRLIREQHPLIQHYRGRRSLEPSVLGSADHPLATVPPPVASLLKNVGVALHQVMIPLRNDGVRLEAYLVARGSAFDPGTLDVARTIAPLARGLDRHLETVLSLQEPDGAEPEPSPDLTPRERTILTLVAESRTADSVARTLGISARTVHKHLENVYRKLGVTDRMAAVQAGQRYGLVQRSVPTVRRP